MRILYFCLFMALSLSACCGKKKCAEYDSVQVSFYGFEVAEIDTVYSTGYARGSNFTQATREKRTDTINAVGYHDSLYRLSPKVWERYRDTYDWELYVPGTGKTYRISDYSYSTYACNCASDRVKSLVGCKVNGKDEPQEIKISK